MLADAYKKVKQRMDTSHPHPTKFQMPFQGFFRVTNEGNTNADVTKHFMYINIYKIPFSNKPVDWSTHSAGKLRSGETRLFATSHNLYRLMYEGLPKVVTGDAHIFVYGVVLFNDGSGRERELKLFYRFNTNTLGFDQITDQDYGYYESKNG